MKRANLYLWLVILIVAFMSHTSSSAQEEDKPELSREDVLEEIFVDVAREIALPKGYHEGILLEGNNMLVNNGENKPTWVVDINTAEVKGEIKPVSTFSEGITPAGDGTYFFTDWNERKLYRIRIEDNKMVPLYAFSFDSARPAGVIKAGENIYVITWTRGMGTKYHLIKMDKEGKNIIESFRIKNIFEPSQIAWDGKNLWISSWYARRVFKVDPKLMKITAFFRTGIGDTTGIYSDGESFWITGTRADLFQFKISD